MNTISKITGVAVMLLACTAAQLKAQQAQVSLSSDSTAVGQPVQLNVTITGGRNIQPPNRINVEGLDVRLAGNIGFDQMALSNNQLKMVNSTLFMYLVLPIKAGTFTIPAVPIKVDGKTIQTQPLTLQVAAPSARGFAGNVPVLPAIPVPQSQPQPPAASGMPTVQQEPPTPNEDDLVFGDLVIPRKFAYVGEVVPVEVRFYFNAEYPASLLNRPMRLSGDGFTVMNFGEPQQRRQEINGQVYEVLTYQTAITPAKTGPLEIGPAELDARISLPMSRDRQRDGLFGGLFGMVSESRDITIKTKPVNLEVKSLPKDGRPADFGGAIGQFSIEALADPKKAAANDPISLSVKISGRGNFDGMPAPTLIDADGWRTYPPAEKFTPSPSDPIGYSGQKTFEYMLMARQDQTKTPVAEFSYFDPTLEKYVTLKSPPIAIEAKGGTAPTPTPAAVVVAAPSPNATPTATPARQESVLVRKFAPGTFQPFVSEKAFLVANGALALGWAAVLFFALGRVVSESKSAKQAAALKETRKLLHQMEVSSCPTDQFYDLAVAFVAARLGSHGRDALENAPVKPETREAVQAILDTHDEMKYSTASASRELPIDERRRIVAQLKSLDEELR